MEWHAERNPIAGAGYEICIFAQILHDAVVADEKDIDIAGTHIGDRTLERGPVLPVEMELRAIGIACQNAEGIDNRALRVAYDAQDDVGLDSESRLERERCDEGRRCADVFNPERFDRIWTGHHRSGIRHETRRLRVAQGS